MNWKKEEKINVWKKHVLYERNHFVNGQQQKKICFFDEPNDSNHFRQLRMFFNRIIDIVIVRLVEVGWCETKKKSLKNFVCCFAKFYNMNSPTLQNPVIAIYVHPLYPFVDLV
jgi:hypothetical protein